MYTQSLYYVATYATYAQYGCYKVVTECVRVWYAVDITALRTEVWVGQIVEHNKSKEK